MSRKKLQLQFISDDSKRKTTYKKRKKGLFKKVSELSTLCGVDACAIIYGPYDPQPEVWPSPLEARQVIKKFKRMSVMVQCRKKESHESFLRHRINKGIEQVKKQQKDNREKELINAMYEGLLGHDFMQNMDVNDINDLDRIIDQHIEELNLRLESFKEQRQFKQQEVGLTPHPQPPSQAAVTNAPVIEGGAPSSVPTREVAATPYTPYNLDMDAMLGPSWSTMINAPGNINYWR